MGFCLLCVHLVVHVHLLLLFGWGAPASCQATLKSGIRNRKETKNQNLESTNQRKQVLEIPEKLLCRAFAFKNKRPTKKSSNKNSLSVEICATVISSEGYDYENLNKVHHNMIPSTLRVSKKQLAGYYHFIYK